MCSSDLPRLPRSPGPVITCAQYDFIATTLQCETGRHSDTLTDLNMFRTYSFKLEQLLAIEKSNNDYHKETIRDLQIRCQQNAIRATKAELKMWELQRANESLSSAFVGVNSNLDVVSTCLGGMKPFSRGQNQQLQTPDSRKTSPPSPLLPRRSDLFKRPLSSGCASPYPKRLRYSPFDLQSPKTPTAMNVDVTE